MLAAGGADPGAYHQLGGEVSFRLAVLNQLNSRHKPFLADVANAHRDLEARKTTGSTILLP